MHRPPDLALADLGRLLQDNEPQAAQPHHMPTASPAVTAVVTAAKQAFQDESDRQVKMSDDAVKSTLAVAVGRVHEGGRVGRVGRACARGRARRPTQWLHVMQACPAVA